ncbi:Protein of unknown function DUF1639 [Dillenia turbinata]|uniref:Uncharacterized protein n=1 Tax=Dillenia turbinata TaxID=194707 RepID=A0AAN8ZBA2_9MAGN
MEKELVKNNNSITNTTNCNNNKDRIGGGGASDGLLRSQSDPKNQSSDFVLQWGSRKRLRCMKIQVKDDSSSASLHKTTVRVDRRVVRADKEANQTSNSNHNNGHINLRHRPSPPPPQRILRNSEAAIAMKANNGNKITSPDRGGERDRRENNHNTHHHHHHPGGGSASSETAAESNKKGGGGSSSGSDAIPPVWPPKFVIALTNKEKEEDFMAIKGSKLPQRPKKRAKFIQRTLNLVSPGSWLCDLTLERYEVREKKISKKRPRGLKAMGNMDSDSE